MTIYQSVHTKREVQGEIKKEKKKRERKSRRERRGDLQDITLQDIACYTEA